MRFSLVNPKDSSQPAVEVGLDDFLKYFRGLAGVRRPQAQS
jgi:hypothetical protein